MTTAEVAETLGISPNTLRYWRQAGSGPAAVKFGGRVMYPREGVEEFIATSAGPGVPVGEPEDVRALRAENEALRRALRDIRKRIDESGLL